MLYRKKNQTIIILSDYKSMAVKNPNVWDFIHIAYKLLSDSLKRELGVFLQTIKKSFSNGYSS